MDRNYGSIYLAASKTCSLFAKHSSAFIETSFGQITICEVLVSTFFRLRLSLARLQIETAKLKNMVKGHHSLYNSSLSTPKRENTAE